MAEQSESTLAEQKSTEEEKIEETAIKKKITVCIKTLKEKKDIEVPEDATVKEIKEVVAVKFNAEVEQLCLIFSGKIMNDKDTLQTHTNNKDDLTVHLVIKTTPHPTDSGSRLPTNANPTPFGLSSLGGLVGFESLGMGSVNFMELQSTMQSELVRNPDLLGQLLNNPLVQRLMNDPENMLALVNSNPQIQELIERNPDINRILNNPELLRQTSDLARNPSMLQELIRNQNRAVGNPESPPASYDSLQRLYQNIQEPVLGDVAEQFSRNLFTGSTENNSSSSVNQQANQASNVSGREDSNTSNRPQSNSMASILQRMSENPQLIQNMFSAPYTQNMLEALSAAPNMANTILAENPLLAGIPTLQQQSRFMMPQFLQQMQNPEVQNLMTNPQALNAILQIQQGVETLRQTVPSVMTSFGQSPPVASSITTSNTTRATDSSTTTPAGGNETTATTISSQPNPSDSCFSEFMARMVAGVATQPNVTLPPEERYRDQLEYLTAMGFVDQEANLQALITTFGDINAAAERLLALGQLSD